jgi:hypothetical protein
MYDEVLKMQKISAELDSALETTAVMLGETMFLENIQFRNCVQQQTDCVRAIRLQLEEMKYLMENVHKLELQHIAMNHAKSALLSLKFPVQLNEAKSHIQIRLDNLEETIRNITTALDFLLKNIRETFEKFKDSTIVNDSKLPKSDTLDVGPVCKTHKMKNNSKESTGADDNTKIETELFSKLKISSDEDN